jgi:hypothetical protein
LGIARSGLERISRGKWLWISLEVGVWEDRNGKSTEKVKEG